MGVRAGIALSVFVVLFAFAGLAPEFAWLPEVPLLAISVLVPLVAYSITGGRAARRSGRVRDGVVAAAVAGIISGIVGGMSYVLFGKSLLNIPVGLALGGVAGVVWGAVGAIVSVRVERVARARPYDGRREIEMPTKQEQEERRAKLSPIQYAVTQNADTEPPFTGAYWDHHGEGTYRCVVCEAPLFDSGTKFESGTGWPSFYDVIEKGNVTQKEDRALGMRRTEVTCGNCGAHLGHLFPDGPRPTGMRYCINSAALDFTPKDDPA